MTASQSGIFALGTSSHAYLEFDLRSDRAELKLVEAMANLREPRTTIGGINLVSGFRPELWRRVDPGGLPAELAGFNQDVVGPDGYVMPATQHDAVLWLSGSAYDIVFDTARAAISALADVASVAEETSSWPYRHDRDLTGFIDGSENPTLLDAGDVALVPEGPPRRGRQRPSAAEVGARRRPLGDGARRRPGEGDRAEQARQRGDGAQAG